MSDLFWLTDEQMDRLRAYFPKSHDKPRVDDRRVLSGIVFVNRNGFSRPGKPTDNAHIETFNGSLRDECLNVHWFASLAEAKRLIEAWRRDYNVSRPHMALCNLTPAEYLAGSGYCLAPIGARQAGN